MENVTPAPTEITAQTQAVELDLSPAKVEFSKNGFRMFFIIFIIFFLLIVAFFIGWGIYVANKNSTFTGKPLNPQTFPSPKFNLASQPGASVDGTFYDPNACGSFTDAISCGSSDTRFWNPRLGTTGKCVCVAPIWGFHGNREAYDDRYLMLGSYDPNSVNITVLGSTGVDRLSFPLSNEPPSGQSICTDLCNNDSSCIGVIYEIIPDSFDQFGDPKHSCTTLTGQVQVQPGNNIFFDPYIEGNLFLKKTQHPVFIDRVFLYTGTLVTRYWLRERIIQSTTRQLTVLRNQLYRLIFFPENYINDGNLTGIYSTIEFTLAEAPGIIANGSDSDHYIHYPGLPLQIPETWDDSRIIWTMYINYP